MKKRLILLVLGGLILIAAASVVSIGLYGRLRPHQLGISQNAILVIQPYKYAGTWVFDDSRTGLFREPFVAGIPEMMDTLTRGIDDVENGFRLTFSANPFPGFDTKLVWKRADGSGNWYFCELTQTEGWLCPGLLRYYSRPPAEIFVKAEAR
jgi:hypothetical protein